jgi:AraC-like DNA-binding protein
MAMNGRPERLEYKTQLDKEFMNRVFRIIESQIANSDFAINDLCYELAMSRSSVYNKIKTLTGRGPNDIIRIVRLSRAKELLSRRPYPINEVATMVGFADPKYFSTCFKKEYGISPSKIGDEWSEAAGFSS